MKWQSVIGFALLTLGPGGSCLAAESQRTVVIHASQLFDGKSDRLASKQVIVIQGQRIADVGAEGGKYGRARLSGPHPSGSGPRSMGAGTLCLVFPPGAICRVAAPPMSTCVMPSTKA